MNRIPSPIEQWKIIQPLLNSPITNCCYIIDKSWFENWQKVAKENSRETIVPICNYFLMYSVS